MCTELAYTIRTAVARFPSVAMLQPSRPIKDVQASSSLTLAQPPSGRTNAESSKFCASSLTSAGRLSSALTSSFRRSIVP
jgi:hypothetical protein